MSSHKNSSLVLLIISAILIVISLATDFWVSVPGGHFGLWRICFIGCIKLGSGADIDSTRAFIIISMLLLLVAVVLQILDYCERGPSTTVNIQKMTAIMSFCAGASAIIAMSIFTAATNSPGKNYSWSYGLGWASAALSLVTGIVAYISSKQETH